MRPTVVPPGEAVSKRSAGNAGGWWRGAGAESGSVVSRAWRRPCVSLVGVWPDSTTTRRCGRWTCVPGSATSPTRELCWCTFSLPADTLLLCADRATHRRCSVETYCSAMTIQFAVEGRTVPPSAFSVYEYVSLSVYVLLAYWEKSLSLSVCGSYVHSRSA